jgi:hypothetical protein
MVFLKRNVKLNKWDNFLYLSKIRIKFSPSGPLPHESIGSNQKPQPANENRQAMASKKYFIIKPPCHSVKLRDRQIEHKIL